MRERWLSVVGGDAFLSSRTRCLANTHPSRCVCVKSTCTNAHLQLQSSRPISCEMGPSSPRSEDVRVALAHVRLGLWLTGSLAAAGIAYALLTPGAPNRAGLVATFAGAMVVGAIVARLPLGPVVGGRWREPFFIAWSCSYLVLISVLCLIDGGVSSALATLFFVPILFSALAYERLSVEIVSGVGLI